ncbi:Ribosome maturation factor rimP [Quillaja saponaria]|uniref:Ribosome maturation factor rimP n=1 Tax=Quillaja saponaria TaxID=32244 RepID=A0AAD7KNX5_QUISA|nr:Ribosome maturation factor rimP [Quillaja saponaria]
MNIRIIDSLLRSGITRRSLSSLSLSFLSTRRGSGNPLIYTPSQSLHIQNPCLCPPFSFRVEPIFVSSSSVTLRFLNTSSSVDAGGNEQDQIECGTSEDGETTDGWEEEDETEPEIGDGGGGGGVVLQGVPWGERALSIAQEALLQFSDDLKLYAFKTTPRGYVYMRLDKLSNEYGCPSMEELESYSREYKKRLVEVGDIPDDLALEVSSPGAERILKVPDDLYRFKDMPMRVCYVEDVGSSYPGKDGVFLLDCVEIEADSCVWKLANVSENRDPLSKGRPLSRKQKDWRLKLPFSLHKRVTLYLEW